MIIGITIARPTAENRTSGSPKIHAALGGGFERGEDALVAEAEDHDIQRFRKLGGARVARSVEDARVIRVDRKDPAGKPDTFERGDDPSARCRLVRGPNYRDRFRSEQRVEPHRPHALSNRFPSTLAASPMQRKRRLGAAAALPQAGPLTGFDLEFHLLGDAQRVVDLDTKVT